MDNGTCNDSRELEIVELPETLWVTKLVQVTQVTEMLKVIELVTIIGIIDVTDTVWVTKVVQVTHVSEMVGSENCSYSKDSGNNRDSLCF